MKDMPLDDSVPTYCDTADVQRALQRRLSFDGGSIPSKEDIAELIIESEEDIDDDCKQAWRLRKRTNEQHSLSKHDQYYHSAGIKVFLDRNMIRDFDSNEGDKLEVWNGSQYEDWLTLSSRTEGRNNDYWVNQEEGILYLRIHVFTDREDAVRVTYRYGDTEVPRTIRKLCAYMVARDLLLNDDNSYLLSESGDTQNLNYEQRILHYDTMIEKIIRRNTRII